MEQHQYWVMVIHRTYNIMSTAPRTEQRGPFRTREAAAACAEELYNSFMRMQHAIETRIIKD